MRICIVHGYLGSNRQIPMCVVYNDFCCAVYSRMSYKVQQRFQNCIIISWLRAYLLQCCIQLCRHHVGLHRRSLFKLFHDVAGFMFSRVCHATSHLRSLAIKCFYPPVVRAIFECHLICWSVPDSASRVIAEWKMGS